MSALLSFSLFFVSFLPLWISILFIDIKSVFIDRTQYPFTEWISIITIALGLILSMIIVLAAFLKKEYGSSGIYTLKEAKLNKTVTFNFMMTYIMPLMAFEFTEWAGAALFVFFFLVSWYFNQRYHVFSANLILELCGYRYYDCILQVVDVTRSDICKEYTLLSKRNLLIQGQDEICVKSLNNEIKMDVTV